jgi:signal transduction histidine kinase
MLKRVTSDLEAARNTVLAQEKLAQQQAHEMRNKYSPAISLLTTYQELTTLEQFLDLKEDMAVARVLLEESEATHQSRLDCYKIMNNNYFTQPEVFSLREVIMNRFSGEEAVAKATTGSQRCDVTYALHFGDMYDYEVSADLYVLNHLLSNLLSNARKHTFRGEIRVEFAGMVTRASTPASTDKSRLSAEDGLLRFLVRDSGKGMDVVMASKLFKTEVATGDTRGTGLGLPSCLIFAEAVGGYCKLAATKPQDSSGDGATQEALVFLWVDSELEKWCLISISRLRGVLKGARTPCALKMFQKSLNIVFERL